MTQEEFDSLIAAIKYAQPRSPLMVVGVLENAAEALENLFNEIQTVKASTVSVETARAEWHAGFEIGYEQGSLDSQD